ncbi:MAG: hypothetical protein WCK46_03045 [Candidatus Adlerbacteria bacterium]
MKYIDNFLNRITMYRLALYYLTVLLAAAAVLGAVGVLRYSPISILFSAALITAVCWGTNEAFARAWKVTPNVESVYITAFILALIISPVSPTAFAAWPLLIAASVIAMASKYILVLHKKHIFNPAAFAVVTTALLFGKYASWWVGGTLTLLPFVLVGGLLVVRKLQRFDLLCAFAAVAAVGISVTFLPQNPLLSVWQTLLHSSLIFLGCIMLTEPLTSPQARAHRLVYGAIVGFFFIPHVHIFSFYTSPELALLVGNVYAYIVAPSSRRILTLVRSTRIAEGIYDFAFMPDKPLSFIPGQYLEWTLGHTKPDDRGNRRYFTIASSPTEQELHLGIKVYEPSSTFKKALLTMQPGQTLSVAQLAGEFTLPKDTNKKLVFIAGGIGITPFRSMVQYMIDTKESRDAILLYSTKTPSEVAYKEVFDAAQGVGVQASYHQLISKETLMHEVPDYKDHMFYISGPRSMVLAFEHTLKSLGVPGKQIKIDFFPGFA